jgi:hypothetical protein
MANSLNAATSTNTTQESELTLLNASSAAWDSNAVTVKASSASWDGNFTVVKANSASWSSGPTTSGRVVQVLSTTDDSTASSSTEAADGWASGTSLTITPGSTSSKILIRMTTSLSTPDWDSSPGIHVQRTAPGSSVALGIAGAAGSRQRTGASVGLGRDSGIEQVAVEYLDAPSTTSACTYEMYVTARNNYTTYLNRSTTDSDAQERNRTVTTITLMEITG